MHLVRLQNSAPVGNSDPIPAASPIQPATLRVLMVEDDPLALQLLTALLASRSDITLVGSATCFADARQCLTKADYDLVFLDVQLFDGNGFDLVPHVSRQARIVFLTGCEQHALRAFEVNALDYIVKPITSKRLAAVVERAQESSGANRALPRLSRDDQIFLRGATAGGIFAELKEIAVVRSSENYSEVVLASGDHTIVRRTMQSWERVLPVDSFVRVHRTAIVNLECIERVVREPDETTQLWLRGAHKSVPVSRRQWNEVRTRLAAAGHTPIQRH